MNKNKETIEKLSLAQKIVVDANLDQEYKQIAFGKAFDYLMQIHKPITASINTEKTEERRPNQVMVAKTFPGFLRQLKTSSHSQKVLAAAYYYLKKDKMIFTKEDIETAYQEAFMPKSNNTNVEINGLIKRGLIMSTKEKFEGKKSYQITMDGISYVEEELMKKND